MKKFAFRTRTATFLTLALGATIVTGFQARAALLDDEPITAPVEKSPFKVVLTVDKADVGVKEAIEMTVTATNTSDKPVEVKYISGQKFDFIANPDDETQVSWSWGMNKRFGQMLSSVTVEPGQYLIHTTKWAPQKAGGYTLRGVITSDPRMEAESLQISVK